MKTLTLSFLFMVAMACTAMAQSNLIVFSDNGEQFYLILNGIRQNEKPQTNVKVTGLNTSAIKAKVIFADVALGEVDKMLPFGTDPVEVTLVVKKAKDGKYAMKFFGQIPIDQAPPTPAGNTVVVYNTTPMPPVEKTTTITHQTTTTTTGDPNNINVNMNGMGVDMHVNTMGMNGASTTTTTTTTTTTNTTTAPEEEHYERHENHSSHERPAYIMPGYNGPVGCPYPMTGNDFQEAKKSISTKSFEADKLTISKQIFDSNCMLTSQVKQVMELFSFEESKLDFAKYAYGRTYDTGNYYKVNDAFGFSSSIDELNSYIKSHKK